MSRYSFAVALEHLKAGRVVSNFFLPDTQLYVKRGSIPSDLLASSLLIGKYRLDQALFDVAPSGTIPRMPCFCAIQNGVITEGFDISAIALLSDGWFIVEGREADNA